MHHIMKMICSIGCITVIMLCGCEREEGTEHGEPTSPITQPWASNNTIRLTDANFERHIFHDNYPVLVYFSASWCTSCRELTPLIEEIAVQYEDRVVIGTVDIDANPKISKRFLIHGIPVLLLFDNGEFVTRLDGFRKKEEIANKLREFLKTVPERHSSSICVT